MTQLNVDRATNFSPIGVSLLRLELVVSIMLPLRSRDDESLFSEERFVDEL